MIYQFLPFLGEFNIIDILILISFVFLIINSMIQKYRHTVKIAWLLVFIPIILNTIIYGFSGVIYIFIAGVRSFLSFFFQVVVFPVLAILVTILHNMFKKKKASEILSIRAPRVIKSFPIDRELIFISYATVDSDFFQIPKLTRILTSYPEINEILYWESDMTDDIYQYMDENLKQCKVVLLFCTKNSLYSEAVKMEWRSALKLDKKIIPIFIEPDDIPALLSTKLGIQFNEDDPYTSIEEVYQMILKKLEVESFREFTKFIVPKWIKEKDFEELNPETIEKSIVFESDISSKEIGIKLALILQDNNFFVPELKNIITAKKRKKKLINFDQNLNHFYCFAELKDDPEDLSLLVKIQEITENLSKIFINAKGRRDWVLNEILRDINLKLIDLKSNNELIRDYSEKIVSLLTQMGDVERFLRRNLGPGVKQLGEIITQYNDDLIEKEEFIIKGTQLVGKDFITVFIKNLLLIKKEIKKKKIKVPPLQY